MDIKLFIIVITIANAYGLAWFAMGWYIRDAIEAGKKKKERG